MKVLIGWCVLAIACWAAAVLLLLSSVEHPHVFVPALLGGAGAIALWEAHHHDG